MDFLNKEDIEWVNGWWAKANRKVRRCLLVGDSTTRQIRNSLEVLLSNICAVDLFAASFSLLDDALYRNLELFIERYDYNLIIVHYGCHHGFSSLCCNDKEIDKKYIMEYERLINILKNKTSNIMIMTGTSIMKNIGYVELDEDIEPEIVRRNAIAYECAQKYDMPLFDLNSFMKNEGRKFNYIDRHHLTRESDGFICYYLVKFIEERKILEKDLFVSAKRLNRQIIDNYVSSRKIIIYGTGANARELFYFLAWNNMDDNIEEFVVSNGNGIECLFNKRVREISETLTEDKSGKVIIVTAENYEDDMIQYAKKLGFMHILVYSELKNKIYESL